MRLVLELVELELGAGASEVAVARVQALLEFHCFAPGVGLGCCELRVVGLGVVSWHPVAGLGVTHRTRWLGSIASRRGWVTVE